MADPDLSDIVGVSAPIAAVRFQTARLLRQLASAKRLPTILLEGETGTGKGLVARLLHRVGPRAAGPFVDVNCAAIPETLLEAELFGFEKGAFTDAREAKVGLFQAAHGGVLFLDEIGLLPRELQAKLLAVLEDRQIRRLGSTRRIAVDVWIVAASNEGLTVAVQAGRMREDLYHRISGITLTLPPLRDRDSDVQILAERFLAKACVEYGLPAKRLSQEAVAALQTYAWPGNVRELGNTIERAVLLSEGAEVTVPMLGLSQPPGPVITRSETQQDLALRTEVERFEREQVLVALLETKWNISFAADRLGMPRNTLRYRMARYGLRSEGHSPRRRKTSRSDEPDSARLAPNKSPRSANQTAPVERRGRQVTWLQASFSDSPDPAPPWAGRAIEILHDKIVSFGGHVEELSARGIVAVFGLEPIEDAPKRAALAGLAIQKAIDRAPASVSCPLSLTVALHVAPAFIEETSETRQLVRESLQVGRAGLVALTRHAPADEVLADATTANLIERWFQVDPIAGKNGLSEASIYRLSTRSQNSLEADTGRRPSHFVGRDREMVLLQERVADLSYGRGQVIGLVGEPGSGKSRLLFEFRQSLAGQPVTFLEGCCLSHGTTMPYLPILDLLRRTWRLDEADNSEIVTATIREHLPAAELSADEHLPYLLRLFGITKGTDVLATLSPETIKQRMFDIVRRIIFSHEGSVVLAIEDLHWADKTSEDFLASIVDSVPGATALFLSTYRPGYRPPWIERSYVTQLTLDPLSARNSRTVVDSILPEPRTSETMIDAIVARGEGNPFFLEELAFAAAQRSGEQFVGTIPPTIRDVLAARVDRLPGKLRQLLQTASVLGRDVPIPLLNAMLGDTSRVSDELTALVGLEFLREQGSLANRVYRFRHALTQEVTYASLSDSERAVLHEAAGRGLETLYENRIGEVLDQLAYHYAETNNAAKAVTYLTQSGEKAVGNYALPEAVTAFEKALLCAERLSVEHDKHMHIVGLAIRVAMPLLLLGRPKDAQDLLHHYEDRLAAVTSPTAAGQFYFVLGAAYDHLGQNDRAVTFARRAVEMGTSAGDHVTVGKAHIILAHRNIWTGHLKAAVANLKQAASSLGRMNEPFWYGLARWTAAWPHILLGEFDEAAAAGSDVLARAAETGNRRLNSVGLCAVGWVSILRGELGVGIAAGERALELAPDPLARAVVLAILGEGYFEQAELTKAKQVLEQSIQLFREFHMPHLESWSVCRLVDVYVREGHLEIARDLAHSMIKTSTTQTFPLFGALAKRALGRVALLRGSVSEAQTHFQEAIDNFSVIEANYEAARTHLDLANLSHRCNDDREAMRHLLSARHLLESMRVPIYLERIERLAAQYAAPPA